MQTTNNYIINYYYLQMVGMLFAQCEVDAKDLCFGYIAVSHADRAIALAFRGTNGFLQLVVEVNHVVLKRKHKAPLGGLVGMYFFNVFNQLWEGGMRRLFERAHRRFPGYSVWVGGGTCSGCGQGLGPLVKLDVGLLLLFSSCSF